MLFTRRKAEIEVLSAARVSAEHGVADLGEPSTDRLREPKGSGMPLVLYLVRKIGAACTEVDDLVLLDGT